MMNTEAHKKDDIMTSQGINVSMAYVEKSSAKAGTELALQVRVKMICPKQKIFSWIVKSTNEIVKIYIKRLF